jgi:hypothetical protein
MAYVEETAPDEPIQNFLEHLLFTVLDNWNPPTAFGNETKLPTLGTSHRRREEEHVEDFTICYVQEELSGSGDERANPTSRPPPGTATRQNSQPAGQLSKANAEKEGTHAQGTNPLSTVQEEWEDQPPHINPGYLKLLFETRSMVDDQIFRAIQIGRHLDMMYAAHSRESPRLQCPMCAQAYAIPAGWRKKDDDGESPG